MRKLLADIEYCRWFDRKHRGRGLLLNPKIARTKRDRRWQQLLAKAMRADQALREVAAALATL